MTPPPRRLVALALAVASLVAVTACRTASDGDPAEPEGAAVAPADEGSGEATPASASTAAAPDDAAPAGAQARLERTTRLAGLRAERPDGLIDAVPGGADAVALVDGAALAAFLRDGPLNPLAQDDAALNEGLIEALAGILGDPALAARFDLLAAGDTAIAVFDDGWWISTTPRAFRSPPTEGAAPVAIGDGTARAQLRDGRLYAWRGEAATAPAGTSLRGSFEQTNAGAMATIWAPVPPERADTDDDLAAVRATGATSVVLAVAPNGALEVALIGATETDVRMALGRAQSWLSQTMGQLRGEASPAWQGAVGYGVLVGDALFHTLSVRETHGGAMVAMAAPTCGTALNNLAAMALIAGVAHVAARDPGVRPLPFVDTRGPIAGGCGAPMAPPRIPTSLAALAPTDASAPTIVVLADVAALLRAELPTAFGLLPFALTHEAVADAVGGAPLALRGLDDAEGSGAMAWEAASGDMSMVAWRGLPQRNDDEVPYMVGSMVPGRTNPFGAVWATAGLDPVPRLVTSSASHPWVAAAQRAPEGAAIVVLVTGATLATGPEDALATVLRDAGVVALSWSPAAGWALTVPRAALADDDAASAAIGARLVALVSAVQQHGPLAESARGGLRDVGARLAQAAVWQADGDAAHLVLRDRAGGLLLEAALRVGLPAMGGSLRHPGIDLPAPVLEPLYAPRP